MVWENCVKKYMCALSKKKLLFGFMTICFNDLG